MHVYRVQDKEGRGPWRPGVSHLWVQARDDHANLPTWVEQFGMEMLSRTFDGFGKHTGCGCSSLEKLRRWFTAEEYATLQTYGYQAVRMNVRCILGQSDVQLVFRRRLPLHVGAKRVELYGPRL